MAKFIMLDHSLFQLLGHHYSYAINVLRAAEMLGDEIVLATHVNFLPPVDWPTTWRVLPIFTGDSYTHMERSKALHNDNTPSPLSAPAFWRRAGGASETPWQRLQTTLDWRMLSPAHRRRQRQRREASVVAQRAVAQYVTECEQVFQQVDTGADDTIFIPTLTVFDLERVVAFLRSQGNSRQAAWHLQFHFNFLDGREPEYAAQEELLTAVRGHFVAQLRPVAGQRIFFYATARPLAAQYNRLGVGHFESLPYPVDEDLQVDRHRSVARKTQRRLRAVCAGSFRPEKGSEHSESIVARLWSDYFAAGRLQLVFQVNVPDLKLPLPDGRTAPFVDSVAEAEAADEPVVCLRAPLGPEDYRQSIQSADIGLLLHEGRRYYTRASGVLVEMLSAGIPVIVPAGCWLSAPIAEATYSHLDRLTARLPAVVRYAADEMPWQRDGGPAGQPAAKRPRQASGASLRAPLVVGGAGQGVSCTLSIPQVATHLALSVTWPKTPPPGVYLQVVERQFDAQGRELKSDVTVLEQRAGNLPVPRLTQLKPGADRIELTLENAFHPSQVELAGVECRFLSAGEVACPAGAVGLIAADHAQLPELLAELTRNFEHYRATAAAFAGKWTQDRLPVRTVERLKLRQALVPKTAEAEPRQLLVA